MTVTNAIFFLGGGTDGWKDMRVTNERREADRILLGDQLLSPVQCRGRSVRSAESVVK